MYNFIVLIRKMTYMTIKFFEILFTKTRRSIRTWNHLPWV